MNPSLGGQRRPLTSRSGNILEILASSDDKGVSLPYPPCADVRLSECAISRLPLDAEDWSPFCLIRAGDASGALDAMGILHGQHENSMQH